MSASFAGGAVPAVQCLQGVCCGDQALGFAEDVNGVESKDAAQGVAGVERHRAFPTYVAVDGVAGPAEGLRDVSVGPGSRGVSQGLGSGANRTLSGAQASHQHVEDADVVFRAGGGGSMG